MAYSTLQTLEEFKEKVNWMKQRQPETLELVREDPVRAFPIIMTQLLQMSERIIAIEEKLG